MVLGRAFVLPLSGAIFIVACHRAKPEPAPTKAKAEFARVKALYQKELAAQKEKARPPAHREPSAMTATPQGTPRTEPSAPATSTEAPRANGAWVADLPVELGPPAQVTATTKGVVMNTREGDLIVARLGRLAHGPTAVRTPLEPAPETTASFGLGYGPSADRGFVYWISHGSLVRRKLSLRGAPGPLEVLARDAFDGTRVAVPLPVAGKPVAPIPPTIAYVVRPEKEDGPLLAKLWVEGREPLVLTAEGNSTHSVALVQTDDGVLALSVQARMAMTPVHARRIRFPGGRPVVGDDTVVWVGGGIQPLTEMTVLPTEQGLVGLIPHERSISEFGIARLDLGLYPTMDTPTSWMLYPNGIDPAPVAASRLCGEPVFLYAEPETTVPDSPQELVVRALADSSGHRSLRVASGKGFYFASIAEVSGGALLAWVTDGAAFACTVRCQTRPN